METLTSKALHDQALCSQSPLPGAYDLAITLWVQAAENQSGGTASTQREVLIWRKRLVHRLYPPRRAGEANGSEGSTTGEEASSREESALCCLRNQQKSLLKYTSLVAEESLWDTEGSSEKGHE